MANTGCPHIRLYTVSFVDDVAVPNTLLKFNIRRTFRIILSGDTEDDGDAVTTKLFGSNINNNKNPTIRWIVVVVSPDD
jgi:hypothetical protein